MKDLMVGGLGALAFALVIYFTLRTDRCRNAVAKLLLRRRPMTRRRHRDD